MSKLPRVKIGILELRQWTHERKEWIVGIHTDEFKTRIVDVGTNRFDINYFLRLNDWDFSRLIVDEYGGKIYPWFGRTGTEPLAAFPSYWAAKNFAVEYYEPMLLMSKMSGVYCHVQHD